MKRKAYWTFIIAKGHSSQLRKITVGQNHIRWALGFLCIVLGLMVLFLTDYASLYVDKWELARLKKDNRAWEQKWTQASRQLEDLEKKVHQISDFSKKIQLITSGPLEPKEGHKGFGKVHFSPELMALSSHKFNTAHDLETEKQEESPYRVLSSSSSQDLEMRIEDLKGKSEWVKQSSWALYTDLLEKQDVFNNTPNILPVKGWISSPFGYRNETIYADHEPYFHHGMDIAATEGSPVVATADGKVSYTGYDEYGYGNLIVIDHGYGLKTYYAHLAEIKTHLGQAVERGDVIGAVGNTGKSTGAHLHYEIRFNGTALNPENYILTQNDLFIY